MEIKEYKLWENGTPYYDPAIGQPETTITYYPAPESASDAKSKGNGCVIVCPGGAYVMRSGHEGKDICEMLNANGFTGFVLNYRVAPYRHPAPLEDALRAVRYVRHNAEKFGVAKDKIAILGFSAGGHLAISASEHFDLGKTDGDETDRESSRPDASVFCYPVAELAGKYTHVGSRENLTGTKEITELTHKLDGVENVRPDMPPVFIWHTFGDSGVPVQNSLNLATALREKAVPVEMHLFPDGPHGLGLAPSYPQTAQWAGLLCNWLASLGF